MPILAARTTIARRALCALAMVIALLPAHADPAPFKPLVRITAGWPGDQVNVYFANSQYNVVDCRLYWAAAEDKKADCDGKHHAVIDVPDLPPGPTGLRWEMEYGPPASPSPDGEHMGDEIPFTVNGVRAAADHVEAEPGDLVTVTFTPVGTGVGIGDCGIDEPVKAACPTETDVSQAQITVPGNALPGSSVALHWYAESGPRGFGHSTGGNIGVKIRPLPPAEFDVRGQADTLGPGQPFIATFRSLTPGVTITGCGLTLGDRSACGSSDVAVVMIPPDTPSGTRLTIPWDLTYSSTRPGEPTDPAPTATGELRLLVEAQTSELAVTVQPAEAYPGDEVVLSFAALRPGVSIVECLAFFPNDPGGICQKSPRRWFARTHVPPNAPPGPTLLRWGAASITAGGRPIADSGAFVFTVRARAGGDAPVGPPGNPPGDPVRQFTPPRDADPRPPTFVATSDPETAAPGTAVTVSVAPLTPGVTITGCTAGFRGVAGPGCSGAGGGAWTARPLVPTSAGPGDQPLDWHVTWSDTTGHAGREAGTIAYRVSEPGTRLQPAFRVQVTPPKAKPGEHVAVTQSALDDGVTITGCEAGFSVGASMASCRDTGQGWVADVTVPEKAPAGTGAVLWNVAYDRAGPGTADGFTRLEVMPTAGPSFWGKLAGFGGRITLGAVALVGFVAYRAVGSRVRERWKQRRARSAELPDDVDVRPLPDAGLFRTDLGAPTREPHPVIRLSPIGGSPRATLREEPP
ncbi:hypothetical protein BJ973_004066 [Actinoplanes tereljensis]|uniref:hypothetical protein n=1 Tax=Paractinoplanes tereljensis TaxID=571912 RepID=UPI00194089F1|nr:hypothetical protein [Actinoplanes tereljensis]